MTLSLLKLGLLTGALQGVVFGVLLATRPVNRSANRILAVLMFLLAIHLVLVAFDERAFFYRYPHFSHVTWLLPVLYGPLVLLFVRRLTGISPAFRRVELLYFLPFVVWLVLLLPYYLESAEAKRAYLDDYARSVQDDFGLLNQLTNFLHLFFFGWSIRVYHRHLRRLPYWYSDFSRVRLSWLRDFLYIAFGIIVLSVFVFYARKWDWPYLSRLYPYHFFGVVVIIYWTAYKAIAQPALFSAQAPSPTFSGEIPPIPVGRMTPPPPEPSSSKLDPALRDELARRLTHLMETERLFLIPELTISDLTDRLQSNRQYVSEVLNGQIGKSFYDFINDYRLEEFKRLIRDPANRQYTLLGLALQAGFNSKATFNAIFKKKTGMTPSQYLRQANRSE